MDGSKESCYFQSVEGPGEGSTARGRAPTGTMPESRKDKYVYSLKVDFIYSFTDENRTYLWFS